MVLVAPGPVHDQAQIGPDQRRSGLGVSGFGPLGQLDHLLGREQRVPGHLAQVGTDQVGGVPVVVAGAIELIRSVHCRRENIRL